MTTRARRAPAVARAAARRPAARRPAARRPAAPGVAALAAVAAMALGACSNDFDPPSYLGDLRVLAIVADPLEAGPGEQVTLAPVLHVPPGQTVTALGWSFCPLALDATQGFACVITECEVALAADPATGAVTVDPSAEAQACVAALAAAGDGGGAAPPELPERIDVVFRLHVETSAGEVRDAIERFPLWLQGPPPERNRPPVILAVTADGVAPDADGAWPGVAVGAEVSIRVTVDPASLDTFTDVDGSARAEAAITSLYATAGRFDADRGVGTDATVAWKAEKLEGGETEALVYAVARDLRGGQTVAGPYRIPLQP
jgi:hypothetical protein